MARWIIAFFVVALIATACTESSDEAQFPEETTALSVSSSSLLQKTTISSAPSESEKSIAPIPYELQQLGRVTLSGQPFDVDSVIGKDIILWFWAPW